MQLLAKELTGEIIDSFFDVYNTMGYGFLENPYSHALGIELESRGLVVGREIPVELFYKDKKVGLYRMDMVVNDTVLIEVKAAEHSGDADVRQLCNYLRAGRL